MYFLPHEQCYSHQFLVSLFFSLRALYAELCAFFLLASLCVLVWIICYFFFLFFISFMLHSLPFAHNRQPWHIHSFWISFTLTFVSAILCSFSFSFSLLLSCFRSLSSTKRKALLDVAFLTNQSDIQSVRVCKCVSSKSSRHIQSGGFKEGNREKTAQEKDERTQAINRYGGK